MNIFKFVLELVGGGKMKEEIRYSVEDIANYFLSKAKMTPKKLQKVLYFAYAWYLAIMNESKDELRIKLFDENFEAWIHGPVCPKIYQKYKYKGADLIEQYNGEMPNITEEDKEILEQVWEVYGKYSANELESISHQHDPWRITRDKNNCSASDWCNEIINDELMFEYYGSKIS